MKKMTFQDRAKTLENAFFYQVNGQLLDNLKRQLAEQEAKEALRTASGISDEELLTELTRIGVRPETLTAVSLIPLVMVAWADGKPDVDEKRAILQAEREAGISEEDPSGQMLEHWLTQRPSDSLMDVWQQYITTLRDKLSKPSSTLLGDELLNRARSVAKASGGTLGLGDTTFDVSSISPGEQRLLDQIKATIGD